MKALLLLPLVLVTGCCKRPVVITQCPEPPFIAKPVLPIELWRPEWKGTERETKALWESLTLAIGYAKANEQALAAYRTKGGK